MLLISSIGTFYGQTLYHLGVDELLEKGIQNSLAIQISEVNTRISADKESLAKNKRLPDVAVTGLFGLVGRPSVLDTDLSFMKHTSTPDWRQNYQVNISQPLYEGGRITNSIKRAELERIISEFNLEKDKSSLKLWLIGKYLDLFNLYEERNVYAENIKEAEFRLKDIKQMKEEGMTTSNDVLRSELNLSSNELLYKETLNDIVLVSQQLTIALGLDESLILEPDSTVLIYDSKLSSSESYIMQGYEKYPEMKISDMHKRVAETNLKITKADYLPSLSLQVGNTLQRPIPNVSPAQDLFLNTWGVSLNVSYKLSALFDRKRSLSSAHNQILIQDLAYDQEKQTVRLNVKAAFVKHQEALDRVDVLENSVKQATENYRIVKNRYFNQLAILTDLLDANSVLLTAELQLTSARANAVYRYYELQKASGNL